MIHHALHVFAYGALTLYGDPSQRPSTNTQQHNPKLGRISTTTTHDTAPATPAGYHTDTV
jgi:hypothetical protein